MTPRWAWRFEGVGASTVGKSPVFTSRFDAELWLGRNWRGIGAKEVDAAVLLHDGAPVPPQIRLVGMLGAAQSAHAAAER